MTLQEIQKSKSIGISISDSPDLKVLGLSDGHLRDAMAEIATHLLASGDHLAYGGDLREEGFTRLLFELVPRYTGQPGTSGPRNVFISHHHEDWSEAEQLEQLMRVTNYFAWPVHIRMTYDQLESWAESVRDVAIPILLDIEGESMTMEHRKNLPSSEPDDNEWAAGLTSMRQTMRERIYARILLGGRVEDYKGRLAGIAEEALLSLQAEQPVFLLGGFGGCARDIAEALDLAPVWQGSRERWPGSSSFDGYGPESLRNGLSYEENQVLATTPYVDQWLPLILRGLRLLRDSGPQDNRTQ